MGFNDFIHKKKVQMQFVMPILFIGYFLSLYVSIAIGEGFSVALTLIGLWLWINDIRNKRAIRFPKPLSIAFGVLFATAVISFLINTKPAGFSDSVFKFRWIPAVLFTGYVISFDFKKYMQLFYKASYVMIPIVGAVCVYQFFTGINPMPSSQIIYKNGDFFRAVGMAGPLTSSYSMALFFVFFVTLFFASKANLKEKMFQVASVLGAFVVPFATISRGPILSMVAGCFLTLLLFNYKIALAITVVMLIAPTALILTNDLFAKKFHDLVTMKDISVTWREKVLRVNWEMFKDHPIFGVGFGNSEHHLREYYDRMGWFDFNFMKATANNYLEFLSGLGILGFSSYVFVCLFFMKVSFDFYRQEVDSELKSYSLALLGVQVCFHASGFMEGIFFSAYPRHFMIMVWAMVLGLLLHKKRLSSASKP